MRVLITGQVGVDKGPYLEGVEELARAAGHELSVYHVGRMMYQEAPDVPAGRILNLPITRLNTLRRALFAAFDFDQIKAFDADLYITMLDNVESVHARLVRDHEIDHTLKDIMV